ncbi:MAG: energy transducer TonB [Acidobacteriota bacterium]|nr:energy transducer TonB [Acidobacteriota bacterium]
MTTMLSDPPSKTTMGVGFTAHRPRTTAGPEAWRTAIGTRPVAARLELLPEGKPRWDRIGLSAIAQVALITFVVLIPLLYPEQIKTALHMEIVQLAQPRTEIPVAPPPPPVKPRPTPPAPKPEVVEPPKLNPQQKHIFVTQKVLQPEVKKVEVKPLELKPVLEAANIDTTSNQPKRPKEEVKLNNLNNGSAAPATVVAPVNKVQTGGFGDPNGIPGDGDPKKSTNINRKGSPALPGGPGYGNGTGGDKGIRGTVASSGFGNGTANPPAGGGKRGSVQTSGFGDQNVVTEAPKKKVAAAAPTGSISIIEKPRPEYTAEGRSLKIEGDVILDLIFLANGTVHVNRVVSGLGHGLDESAIRAAEQIKFKPAIQDSQPVDFPARVRIEFRMAY